MAFSGVVIADAHDVLVVRSVGEAEYKAKGAFNRNLRMVVLPAENRVDLEASVELPGAIREEICATCGTSTRPSSSRSAMTCG